MGIIANNRTEWAVAAYATYSLGGRFVPMYETELPRVWQYVVTDSAVTALFVAKPQILEKVKDFSGKIPTLKHLILIEGSGAGSMEALEAEGRAQPVKSIHPQADEIASLIYTSGTTGEPKGVLLAEIPSGRTDRLCKDPPEDGGAAEGGDERERRDEHGDRPLLLRYRHPDL